MEVEDAIYGLAAQAEKIQKHAIDLHALATAAIENAQEEAQKVSKTIKKATLVSTAYLLAAAFLVSFLAVTGLNWYVGLKRAELTELRNQAAVWEQKAGKANLTTCGPKDQKGRLCVKVVKKAGGYGEDEAWMIIDGY